MEFVETKITKFLAFFNLKSKGRVSMTDARMDEAVEFVRQHVESDPALIIGLLYYLQRVLKSREDDINEL